MEPRQSPPFFMPFDKLWFQSHRAPTSILQSCYDPLDCRMLSLWSTLNRFCVSFNRKILWLRQHPIRKYRAVESFTINPSSCHLPLQPPTQNHIGQTMSINHTRKRFTRRARAISMSNGNQNKKAKPKTQYVIGKLCLYKKDEKLNFNPKTVDHKKKYSTIWNQFNKPVPNWNTH